MRDRAPKKLISETGEIVVRPIQQIDADHDLARIAREILCNAGILAEVYCGISPVENELRRIKSVFTVGNASNYDRGLKEYGDEFEKRGRRENYPGGFAVNTIDDGLRLIEEQGKTGIWGVYRLDAVWLKDTVPSENGWWHALINDSRIIERVA